MICTKPIASVNPRGAFYRRVEARTKQTTTNVNRRFAGCELKFAVAAADDETTERK